MITFEQYSKAFYDGYHVKCDEINGIPSQGRCKIEYGKFLALSTDVNYSDILKDFIEYLQDRNFVDDDIWQENDVIKEFLNEKETRR